MSTGPADPAAPVMVTWQPRMFPFAATLATELVPHPEVSAKLPVAQAVELADCVKFIILPLSVLPAPAGMVLFPPSMVIEPATVLSMWPEPVKVDPRKVTTFPEVPLKNAVLVALVTSNDAPLISAVDVVP